MKHYPKTTEDRSKRPTEKTLDRISSASGSVEELEQHFRDLYHEAHPLFFNWIVKQVWLEQQFLLDGIRRLRFGNGQRYDWIFSFFAKGMVGISQKPLTTGIFAAAVATYIEDFFPDFSLHNPFKEPEYFKYPFKHVTLDHMTLVYQVHNRLEMLEEAERRSMSSHDFENEMINWVANYSLTQPEVEYKGEYWPCYIVRVAQGGTPYIKDLRK